MSPLDAFGIWQRLSDRDRAILTTLREYRLATTGQLQRLHFRETFGSKAVATRVTQRVLGRLEEQRLISRLERTVGGASGGSSSLIWQLAARGDTAVRASTGDITRRRFVEPGWPFIQHTLDVTELVVQLQEADAAQQLEVLTLEGEPRSWRRFLGAHGRPETLKPDLYAVTANGDFEDYWAIELDRSNEHLPAIRRKAEVYQRYHRTGRHQAEHGVFPAVIWVVPTAQRRQQIQRALAQPRLGESHFHVVQMNDFMPTILGGADPGTGPPAAA